LNANAQAQFWNAKNHPNSPWAAFEPPTQQPRVGAAMNLSRARTRADWVDGSSPSMVKSVVQPIPKLR